MGGAKAHYDGIVAFSQTDFTEELKKITVPVLVMHGDDDQIVPDADSGPLSAKLSKNDTLKTYKGLSVWHANHRGRDHQRRAVGLHQGLADRRPSAARERGRRPATTSDFHISNSKRDAAFPWRARSCLRTSIGETHGYPQSAHHVATRILSVLHGGDHSGGNRQIALAATGFHPGHGNPLSKKAELAAYRDMLVAIRENVAKLKQQGRSLDETIAAKPTAAFDAKWGQFVITPALFTRLVYQGV